jgi:hypothetical protein
MALSKLRNRFYLSSAPGGYGTITKKGYRRIYDAGQKRYRFEHDMVWEQNYGPIPDGFEIHHKDQDKLNNIPFNLQLVNDLEQKRIHSGCVIKDGQWQKPCRRCKELKPVDEYYKVKTRNCIMSICKACTVALAINNKRRNKLLMQKAVKIA